MLPGNLRCLKGYRAHKLGDATCNIVIFWYQNNLTGLLIIAEIETRCKMKNKEVNVLEHKV